METRESNSSSWSNPLTGWFGGAGPLSTADSGAKPRKVDTQSLCLSVVALLRPL
jgi:hypothetical protein